MLNTMKPRNRARLIVLFSLAPPLLAQSPKVERIASPPDGLPHDVTAALEDKGYRVTLDDGWTAELWLAKNLKLAAKDSPGALYPELSNGEFVGVLHLPKGMSDFRGQAVPAGTYTLRYQLLPQDANHLGSRPTLTSCSPSRSPATPSPRLSIPSTSWSPSARSPPAHIRQSSRWRRQESPAPPSSTTRSCSS